MNATVDLSGGGENGCAMESQRSMLLDEWQRCLAAAGERQPHSSGTRNVVRIECGDYSA